MKTEASESQPANAEAPGSQRRGGVCVVFIFSLFLKCIIESANLPCVARTKAGL